ncbi:MAG: hypothetical protein EXS49_00710, partial [Candidatus Pacebacteria bacterium]|nr:hypothetical protein [Candidatus Paceibacterota bacterium]
MKKIIFILTVIILLTSTHTILQAKTSVSSFFMQITSGSSDKEFPAINDSKEIIWVRNSNNQIVSNIRGQITRNPNQKANPSINNRGEIVYQELINGYSQIVSSIRGQITSTNINHTDPFISNCNEIIWIEDLGGTTSTQIISSKQGQLTFSGTHIAPSINCSGEYVWGVSDVIGNRIINSNKRGVISNDGISPVINDWGEIVWFQADPNIQTDYQLFSSVRGQLTHYDAQSFKDQLFYPYIN